MKVRFVLPLLILLISACDTAGPGGDPEDPLTVMLRRASVEVSAFGGATFEADHLVVYTLGDDPASAEAIRERINLLESREGERGYDIRVRPARGAGSAELATQVEAAVETDVAHSVDLDSATNYVRVGVFTADAVRYVTRDLADAGVPMDNVIVHVRVRS